MPDIPSDFENQLLGEKDTLIIKVAKGEIHVEVDEWKGKKAFSLRLFVPFDSAHPEQFHGATREGVRIPLEEVKRVHEFIHKKELDK